MEQICCPLHYGRDHCDTAAQALTGLSKIKDFYKFYFFFYSRELTALPITSGGLSSLGSSGVIQIPNSKMYIGV
jgi:hypothetical protein